MGADANAVTAGELAQEWGVSRASILREVRRGRLLGAKLLGQVRIKRVDAARYWEERIILPPRVGSLPAAGESRQVRDREIYREGGGGVGNASKIGDGEAGRGAEGAGEAVDDGQ